MDPTFAIVSDLHIEASNTDLHVGQCDALIAAGDIHVPDYALLRQGRHSAVEWLVDRCPDVSVFFVPGNHDYEGTDVEVSLAAMRRSAEGTNVQVLWNEAVDFNGIRILGTPLFSSLVHPGRDPEETRLAVTRGTDLGHSGYRGTRLDADWLIGRHHESTDFLRHELSQDAHIPKVVITHWAPSLRSQGLAHRNSPAASYWASDCEDLVAKATLWVHGHVHDTVDYRIGDDERFGRVISNPRGFSKLFGLPQNVAFVQPFLVKVPTDNVLLRSSRAPSP
jgi:DNA repair exonuclease SbcCD nuclease subunit